MRDKDVLRLIGFCTVLAVAGAPLRTSAQPAIAHYKLDIPRESLDAALKAFARQTGLQIARFSDVGSADTQVGPVSGNLTSEQALKTLLADTGLTYRVLNNGTFAVVELREMPDSNRIEPGPAKTASDDVDVGRRKQGNFSSRSRAAGAQRSGISAKRDRESPTDSTQVAEVVVAGIRPLESALASKYNSDLAIESVAPEDIGKMPDQNVAESLQRLPGLQIDRANGQGTQVLIDGLRQNLATLNGELFLTGREFYVSGEASGGGTGGNAQYNSLEGIPRDEVSGIDVYKNPKASMLEGSIGGTIDLKTPDPLAQPIGLSIGGNARGTISDGTSGATPNATMLATFKVSDALAFSGSVSYDKERTHTKEFQDQNRNEWTITNSALAGSYKGSPSAADFGTLPLYSIDPRLAYFSDINDERLIEGANFGVALKLTDAVKTQFTWFHSNEDDTSFTYSDKAWFNGQGGQVTVATDSFGHTMYDANGNPVYKIPTIPGIDPTHPYSIDGNGVVQSGTFNANGAETATFYQRAKDISNNFQWITRFDNGGPLRGTFGAFYAHASSNLQAAQADIEHGLYETSAGAPTSPGAPGCNNGAATCDTDPFGSHGYQFLYSNGGTSGLPNVSYAPNPNVLTNPAWTTFKSNWAWANYTTQSQKAFKLDAVWDQSSFASFSAGARYGTRDVDQIFGRYLINGTLANGQVAGGATGCNTAAAPNICGPFTYYQDPGYGTPNIPYSTATTAPGLAMSVNNFGVGNVLVKNPYTGGMTNPSTFLNTIWAGAGVPNNTEQFFEDGLSSFAVHEKTESGYVMADLGSKEDSYHINLGLRFVHTQLTVDNGQSAESPTYFGTAVWNGVDSNVVPVASKRAYNDILPSINLTFKLTNEQLVRVGAARVTAPQDQFSLGLGYTYTYTRQTQGRVNINTGVQNGFAFSNGSSGNPLLDPYRATQFRVSYENYFAPGAVAAADAFFKLIDSSVTTENIPTLVKDDFGGTVGNVTQPINAGSGQIYGLELGSQYSFDCNVVRGLGIAANYALSESTSNQSTSFTQHSQIPGVSQNSFTGTLIYERFGFSGRLSYSWRSKAVNDSLVGATFEFPDQLGSQKVYQIFQAPHRQLDGQVGYDFLDGHMGIVLSAQNLTKEALHTYLQWPNLPFTYDNSGRRYFFGIRFKN
jgi:iron complex outermembrane recepter protein